MIYYMYLDYGSAFLTRLINGEVGYMVGRTLPTATA